MTDEESVRAAETLEQYREMRSAVTTEIALLRKRTEGRVAADVAALEAALAKTKMEYDALQKQKNAVGDRILQNTSAISEISSLLGEYRTAAAAYDELADLARAANGDAAGSAVRMKFEEYVQSAYLSRILEKANIGLWAFELDEGCAPENNSSKSGLDLDVIDHYNGTERSVSSLSGGESFKAVLSLALGLSDVIMESSGGIELDALFIDEGFGTLSPEYLDAVMGMLEKLHDMGGKKVGIISHVDFLKERIPTQIRVTKKGHNGTSEISIISL